MRLSKELLAIVRDDAKEGHRGCSTYDARNLLDTIDALQAELRVHLDRQTERWAEIVKKQAAESDARLSGAYRAAAEFVEANAPYLQGVGSVGVPMADHIRKMTPADADRALQSVVKEAVLDAFRLAHQVMFQPEVTGHKCNGMAVSQICERLAAAQSAVERELMECHHPRACWIDNPNDSAGPDDMVGQSGFCILCRSYQQNLNQIAKCDDLETELSKWKDAHETMRIGRDELQIERDGLLAELSKWKDSALAWEKTANEIDADRNSIQAELSKLRAEVAIKRQSYEGMAASEFDLRKQVVALEAERYALREAISRHLIDAHSGTDPKSYEEHAKGESVHKLALLLWTEGKT
jgi:hypothetical protein